MFAFTQGINQANDINQDPVAADNTNGGDIRDDATTQTATRAKSATPTPAPPTSTQKPPKRRHHHLHVRHELGVS